MSARSKCQFDISLSFLSTNNGDDFIHRWRLLSSYNLDSCLIKLHIEPNKKFKNLFFFYQFMGHCCIFTAFHLDLLIVVNFLSQILHDIGIFNYIYGTLFCGWNLDLDLKNLINIAYLWIGLLDGFPNLPNYCKKHTCFTNFKGHWNP